MNTMASSLVVRARSFASYSGSVWRSFAQWSQERTAQLPGFSRDVLSSSKRVSEQVLTSSKEALTTSKEAITHSTSLAKDRIVQVFTPAPAMEPAYHEERHLMHSSTAYRSEASF